MLRSALFVAFSLALLPQPGVGQTAPPFAAGERVVFIGDSITHGGPYHADAYLFYATRFPGRRFEAYNAGISGDTAGGTNVRFETDIAAHRPNAATVMLGMNDAWSNCFGPEAPTDKMLEDRQRAYDTYRREMSRLADSLDRLGCRVTYLKPSIYDETAELAQPKLRGKNDELIRYGEFLDTLAAEHDATLVDFNTPMLAANARLQAEDPAATVVGADRVHPGAAGHFVMTYTLLKSQGMPAVVSSLGIDAAKGRLTKTDNCEIAPGSRLSPGRLEFTCTENALPFPVTNPQAEALDWVPFQQELNQQRFQVTGLMPGDYTLEIDGEEVGQYTAEDLAAGVNLSDNRQTPQHRQALRVRAANNERLAAASTLRAIAHVRYTMIAQLKPTVAESDREALGAALTEHVDKSKDKPWHGYLRGQVKRYLDAIDQEGALKAQELEAMQRVWVVNQPEPHRWVLRATEP